MLQNLYYKGRASMSPQRVDQLEISDQNPLDLLLADGIIRAIIQLGRARRLVVRDLEPTAPCGLGALVGQSPLRVAQHKLRRQETAAVVLFPITGY
jgi:hypothetical protein